MASRMATPLGPGIAGGLTPPSPMPADVASPSLAAKAGRNLSLGSSTPPLHPAAYAMNPAPGDSAKPTFAISSTFPLGAASPLASGIDVSIAGGVTSIDTPSSASSGGSIACEISARCSLDLLPSALPAGPTVWEEDEEDREEEARMPLGAAIMPFMPAAFQFTSLRAASTTPTCSGGGAADEDSKGSIPAAPTSEVLLLTAAEHLVGSDPRPPSPGGFPNSPSDYWHQRLEKALHQRLENSCLPDPLLLPNSVVPPTTSREAIRPSRPSLTLVHNQLQGRRGVAGGKLGRMESSTVDAQYSDPHPPLIASPGPAPAGGSALRALDTTDGEARALPAADNNGSSRPDAVCCGGSKQKGILEGLKSRFRSSKTAAKKDGQHKYTLSKPSFWSIYGINI